MNQASLDLDTIRAGLERFMRADGGPGGTVHGLKVMEAGHAGLTFGFELETLDGASRRGLVLKLAPAGVRRVGNTDVFRQAPLLRTLHRLGIAAPDVPFADAGEAWLGAPFIVMERLRGEPFFVWRPDASFDLSDAAIEPLWTQTIDAMIAFHRLDWPAHLAGWEAPRPLRDELLRWDPVLAKSPSPEWAAQGRDVRDALLRTLPDGAPVGLVHGDLQPGNALFDAGRLTGIIDWELASIGSLGLDVGWLMMMADAACWPVDWRPACPLSPDDVARRYLAAMGGGRDTLDWYEALAGYRLGAIACLNVHLHRGGRRPDPTWERFADAIPLLFARARALVDAMPPASGAHR